MDSTIPLPRLESQALPRLESTVDALGGIAEGLEMTQESFVLYALARGLSADEANAVFEEADLNHDGTLQKDEVEKALMSTVTMYVTSDEFVEHRRLLKECWPTVLENKDTVINQFYDHLFEENPVVKPLFEGIHMETQKRMLASVLNTLVNGLDDVGAIVPKLQKLGQRHVGYGATPEYYGAVGGSLVYALQKQLQDSHWCDELADAWVKVYQLVVKVMLSAEKSERTFAKAVDALGGIQEGVEMTQAAFVAYAMARGLSAEEANATFEAADENKDGTLQAEEVEKALQLSIQHYVASSNFEEHRQALKGCWPKVLEDKDTVIDNFYNHLFEQNPGVVPLFEGIHMETQKRMLGSILNTLVNGLDDVGAIVPKLQKLGQRHVGYGAKPEYYGAVGGSLIHALQTQLSDTWDDQLANAWVSVYGLVVKVMLSAEKSERKFAKAIDTLEGIGQDVEMTRAAFVKYAADRGLPAEEANALFDEADENEDGTLQAHEVLNIVGKFKALRQASSA
jgi:hemoglobin-like flavoprotein